MITYCVHRDSKFKKSDAFIGFQMDTPASVIFQATNQLRSACAAIEKGLAEGRDEYTKTNWKFILRLSKLNPEEWDSEEVNVDSWRNGVSLGKT